jgi:hypothetical protein
MLPAAYELPAAVLIAVGGTLACFAGYRLFRVVLGVYGFVLGAAIASSVVGTGNATGMVAAAIGGGVAGAVILVLAWFVGVALVGAGIGALVTHVVWSQVGSGDPHWMAVVALSVAGAIGAMVLQRYVIIVGTAFGGAWTMLVGAMSALAARAGAAAGSVWILYPTSPAPGERWVPLAWIGLGLVGAMVQLNVTGKKRW